MNFPILSSLILLPTVGALFLFFTKDKEGNNLTAKYVSLFTSIVNFLISIFQLVFWTGDIKPSTSWNHHGRPV